MLAQEKSAAFTGVPACLPAGRFESGPGHRSKAEAMSSAFLALEIVWYVLGVRDQQLAKKLYLRRHYR
jgi:hypothetical protein